MIKNIIFDLSEVLISGYYGVEKIVAQNTEVSEEQFLKRKQETLDIFFDCMRGKYLENEYLEILLKGTNWNINEQDLKKYIRQCLNKPVVGTMKLVQTLSNNYQLILLSDHIKEWGEYILDNNQEISIFEHQFFSYEYGKLKTDEGCFEYVLSELKINPEETIFIDDCQENIDMAKKSGISGVLFENAEQLKKELRKRKIL